MKISYENALAYNCDKWGNLFGGESVLVFKACYYYEKECMYIINQSKLSTLNEGTTYFFYILLHFVVRFLCNYFVFVY